MDAQVQCRDEFYYTNGADPTDMMTVPKADSDTKLDIEEKTTKEIQHVNHQTLASKGECSRNINIHCR